MNSEVKTFEVDRCWVDRMEKFETVADLVSVEEPLQVMLYHENEKKFKDFTITMRTPRQDKTLILGFLYNEHIIKNLSDVIEITEGIGLIKVKLSREINIEEKINNRRHFIVSSSCGICGDIHLNNTKQDELHQYGKEKAAFSLDKLALDKQIIFQLAKNSAEQKMFKHTGGLHASMLFNITGELIDTKEDVGRHNALDKIIGQALLDDKLPLTAHILFLSGRVSYELVQKAAMGGLRCICALGAPSSLAIETAKTFDISLIGFITNKKFNIYNLSTNISIE